MSSSQAMAMHSSGVMLGEVRELEPEPIGPLADVEHGGRQVSRAGGHKFRPPKIE
jgi:hypothetical protein